MKIYSINPDRGQVRCIGGWLKMEVSVCSLGGFGGWGPVFVTFFCGPLFALMVFTVGWAVPLGCIWALVLFFFVLTTFKIDVCEGPDAVRAQDPCGFLGPFCSLFSAFDLTPPGVFWLFIVDVFFEPYARLPEAKVFFIAEGPEAVGCKLCCVLLGVSLSLGFVLDLTPPGVFWCVCEVDVFVEPEACITEAVVLFLTIGTAFTVLVVFGTFLVFFVLVVFGWTLSLWWTLTITLSEFYLFVLIIFVLVVFGTFLVSGLVFIVSRLVFIVSRLVFIVSRLVFIVSGWSWTTSLSEFELFVLIIFVLVVFGTFLVSGLVFIVSRLVFIVSGLVFIVSRLVFIVFGLV